MNWCRNCLGPRTRSTAELRLNFSCFLFVLLLFCCPFQRNSTFKHKLVFFKRELMLKLLMISLQRDSFRWLRKPSSFQPTSTSWKILIVPRKRRSRRTLEKNTFLKRKIMKNNKSGIRLSCGGEEIWKLSKTYELEHHHTQGNNKHTAWHTERD